MVTQRELLRQFDDGQATDNRVLTGIRALDDVTHGPSPGQVWIVTSAPGQGRTTLLTQLADTLSVEQSWAALLIYPREPLRTVAARLTSLRTREVLSHLTRGDSTAPDSASRRGRMTALEDAPLDIVTQGDHDPMSVADEVEANPPTALLVDDAHHVAGALPARLRSLADADVFVASTLPRRLVVTSDTEGPYLEPEWADIADVIVEIRQATWPASDSLRPGEADFSVLRNRWGPCRTVAVASQPHYSRFADLPL